ncbi:MAG: hypothetical protein GQ534_02155 [Candidatus Delongbacteria bacterium]|nr:hypothetical protein [Candidatus Delongbacteria bacterium]
MKKIIILLNPEASAYNASFKFAKNLSDLGYEVIYFTYPNFTNYVKEHSFKCIEIIPDSELDYDLSKVLIEKSKNTILSQMKVMSFIEQEIDKIKPFAVFVDQINWWYALPFFKKKIKVIGLNTNLCTRFNSFVPPTFYDKIPDKRNNIISRFKNILSWLHLYTFEHFAGVNLAIWRRFVLVKLNRKRAWWAYVVAFWGKEFKRRGIKISFAEHGFNLNRSEIVLCPREFDFLHVPFADKRIYVGTSVENFRNEEIVPMKDKGNSCNFILDEEVLKNKKLIYCSIGSHDYLCHNKENFFKIIIETIQERKNLYLIIQIFDEKIREILLKKKYDNIKILRWAPQLKILKKADYFITHGGLSSVREAILTGTPMICLPYWNDGFGNAARIRFHKLGVTGYLNSLTKTKLNDFLDEIISNEIYQESVKIMQSVFENQLDGTNLDKVTKIIET